MMVKGPRIWLKFVLTLAVLGFHAYSKATKRACLNIGGQCINKKIDCPDDLPLETMRGKPFCRKKDRCCYPKTTQCSPATALIDIGPFGICARSQPVGWFDGGDWCFNSQDGCTSYSPPGDDCSSNPSCRVGLVDGICTPTTFPPGNGWTYQGKGWGCNDNTCECFTPYPVECIPAMSYIDHGEVGICAHEQPWGWSDRGKWCNLFTDDPFPNCISYSPPAPCSNRQNQTCQAGLVTGICTAPSSPPGNGWIYQGKELGCNDDPCECYTPWA